MLFAILPALIGGLLFLKCTYTFFFKNNMFSNWHGFFKGQKMINLKMKTKFEILAVSKETEPFLLYLLSGVAECVGFPKILHYLEVE